jgi:hypothetical protein
MSINRFIVVLPVLAGLVVTGSAVARMMPRQSVRDTVYQTCAHNGVHFNKQGHANCGLHLGWSDGSTGDTGGTGDQPATEPGGGASPSTADTARRHTPGGKGHVSHGRVAHAGNVAHGHSGHVSHASTPHGHAGGHGKAHGHSKG